MGPPVTFLRDSSLFPKKLPAVLDDNALVRRVDLLAGKIIDGIACLWGLHCLDGRCPAIDYFVDLNFLEDGGTDHPAILEQDVTILQIIKLCMLDEIRKLDVDNLEIVAGCHRSLMQLPGIPTAQTHLIGAVGRYL